MNFHAKPRRRKETFLNTESLCVIAPLREIEIHYY
jgi:hypothetical protein